MVPGQNDMGSGGMGFEQIAKMMVTLWLQRLPGSFLMMKKVPVGAHFQVTSIYCLLGLALISMGISLASEQVFGYFYLYFDLYLCIWCICKGEDQAGLVCLLNGDERGRRSCH